MKLSIALASYNGEAFLKKQLESLLTQTLKADEVIIGDDCSADGSAGIIEGFIKKNKLDWKLIINRSNLGYIDNFRSLLSYCTGDYIFLCDQDDIWKRDKLEVMVKAMNSNSSMLALASDYRPVDENDLPVINGYGKIYARSGLWKDGTVHKISGRLYFENIAQGCCCCYRRKIVEKYLELGDNCLLPHDWALNMLAFEADGLYYIKKPLVAYRVHEGNSLGLISKDNSVTDRQRILNDYADKLQLAAGLFDIIKSEKSENIYNTYSSLIKLRAKIAESGPDKNRFSELLRYPAYMTIHSLPGICKDIISNKI